MTVDGEDFLVHPRPSEPGVYDVSWLTAPNPPYGFSSANNTPRADTPAETEDSIRNFLAQVDPTTGYIED